jgi:hypothetical protein
LLQAISADPTATGFAPPQAHAMCQRQANFGEKLTMKLKLSAVALLAIIMPAQTRAATLTDGEATFLDQLVTAAAVLAQQCTGYEVNGAGGVQYGASILGSPNAAMAMIDAFDAAIKAQNGNDYDASKFRLEVSEVAGKTFNEVRANLIKNPEAACADYGETSVSRGLLRRY